MKNALIGSMIILQMRKSNNFWGTSLVMIIFTNSFGRFITIHTGGAQKLNSLHFWKIKHQSSISTQSLHVHKIITP
jgi:hypothetical protein